MTEKHETQSSLTMHVAEFAAAPHILDLPDDVIELGRKSILDGLGLADKLTPNPNYDAYYGLIDFEFWARKNIGDDAVEHLKRNVHPLDLAFRLAEAHGIVLLNGGGFDAPEWSLRVSLASRPCCGRTPRRNYS